MNHLLHPISWHQYFAAAIIAAVIYYLAVILRFYRPELEKIKRKLIQDNPDHAFTALQYQAEEEEGSAEITRQQQTITENYTDQELSETDILTGQLKACITRAADQPYAPAILIPQLKHILQQYSTLAADERPAINHLVVNECEKSGTVLLTEEEVDQWWER